jgi:hypothetical protein
VERKDVNKPYWATVQSFCKVSFFFETQWFRHQTELESRDWWDSPTLTDVGCHWGPVIPISARIGSPGLGRFPYSHCCWVPWGPAIPTSARIGRPGPGKFPYSHCCWVPLRRSDSNTARIGTGEIPLLSLWLGGHWGPVIPTLSGMWSQGDPPTLTAVGRHWGPVISTLARDREDSPTLFLGVLGARITGIAHTTRPLVNQLSCTGENVGDKVIG